MYKKKFNTVFGLGSEFGSDDEEQNMTKGVCRRGYSLQTNIKPHCHFPIK